MEVPWEPGESVWQIHQTGAFRRGGGWRCCAVSSVLVSHGCHDKLPYTAGLKQRRFLSYSSTGQKSYMSLAKIRVSAGLQGCILSSGESVSSSFKLLETCPQSLAGAPFFHLQSRQCGVFQSPSPFCLLLSSTTVLGMTLGPPALAGASSQLRILG